MHLHGPELLRALFQEKCSQQNWSFPKAVSYENPPELLKSIINAENY